jgi:hypothetical protein
VTDQVKEDTMRHYSYVRRRPSPDQQLTLSAVVRSLVSWIDSTPMTTPTLEKKIHDLINDHRRDLSADDTQMLMTALDRYLEQETRIIKGVIRSLDVIHSRPKPCPTCGHVREPVKDVTPRAQPVALIGAGTESSVTVTR